MPRLDLKKIDLALVSLLLIGLAVRIGYLVYYHALPEWDHLTVDNNYHHHWAQSIAAGNVLGDTTYFRAPGYVFFLGALYRLFGDSLWVARLFGVVLGVASIALTYLTAKRVFDRRVALVAAAVQLFCPILIYFEGELLLDSLFALTVQVCLYRAILWIERPTSRNLFSVGIALGFSAIVRPTSLVFLAVLVLLALLTLRDRRQRLVQIAWLVLGVALLVAPIFLRNMIVAGDPVLIASQGGVNFYIGNNPTADGLSASLPEPIGFNLRIGEVTSIAEEETGRPLKPGEVSSYWSGLAWRWIFDHPGQAAGLYARKLYFTFSDREVSNDRNLPAFFAVVPFLKYNPLTFAPLFGLAVLGLIVSLRRSRQVKFLALAVLSLCCCNAAFFVNSRFRLPMIPLLIILAAVALTTLAGQFRSRRWRTFAPALAIAVLMATFSTFVLRTLPRGTPAQWLNSQVLYYYGRHDDSRALELGRRAALADSTFPEVNLNLGNLWLRAGQADSAAFYFRREISANPGRAKGYTNLASLYYLERNLDSAASMVRLSLDRQPQEPVANVLLIRVLAAKKSLTPDSLRRAVKEAIVRSKGDLRVLTESASGLVQRNLLSEAEPLLRTAITSRPPAIETDDAAFEHDFPNTPARFDQRKATAYYLLGFVMGRSNRFDDANRFSREAIRRDSTMSEAYVNLVSGYLSLGNTAEADSIVAIAVQRFPQNQHLRQLSNEIEKMKKDRW